MLRNTISVIALFVLCCFNYSLQAQMPVNSDTVIKVSNPNDAGGLFGICSGIGGDLNGDGSYDFLVSALEEMVGTDKAAGRVYVLNGADGSLIRTLTSPNAIERGYFGAAVSEAGGDLNGDGIADYLVGALEDPAGVGFRSGTVYCYSGSDGSIIYQLQSPYPMQDARFGESIAPLGDITGDLVPDFIVGAYLEDNTAAGTIKSGRAYVYDGAAGTFLFDLQTPNPTDTGLFARSVASVRGDLDGDGVHDILVGAYKENPDGSPFQAGRVYVFSGADGSLMRELKSFDEQHKGWYGRCVEGLGDDVDHDGFPDFVVTANYENDSLRPDNAGRAYLMSGQFSTCIKQLRSPYDTDGRFGISLASLLGDLNGDGSDDFLIGAWGDDPPGMPYHCGRAYVFNGADGEMLMELESSDPEYNGRFSQELCALLGDGNGDGLPDAVVGSAWEHPTADPKNVGCAYLYHLKLPGNCDDSSPITGLQSNPLTFGVFMSWDLMPGTEACKIKATRLSPAPSISRSRAFIDTDLSNISIANSILGAGSSWSWQVQCTCDPYAPSPVLSPLSVADTFNVPVLREAEEGLRTALHIFPNPTSNLLYLEVPATATAVLISDMSGKVVLEEQTIEAGLLMFNVEDLASGQYFISLEGSAIQAQFYKE